MTADPDAEIVEVNQNEVVQSARERRFNTYDASTFWLAGVLNGRLVTLNELLWPEAKNKCLPPRLAGPKVGPTFPKGETMPTASALEASRILRDGSSFQWYVIALFALVVYVYAVEIERRNWNLFFAGLAFWGMDWFNEIWNGLVFHFTGYAPVWGAPGKTAFLILIGLNIEICFMFAVAGITFAMLLPAEKNLRILGLPNRPVLAVVNSVFCVLVECLLNGVGALTWDYSWWALKAPWLIILVGYLPFFLVSFWVHDMDSVRNKALTVGGILGVDLVALLVFGTFLRWI